MIQSTSVVSYVPTAGVAYVESKEDRNKVSQGWNARLPAPNRNERPPHLTTHAVMAWLGPPMERALATWSCTTFPDGFKRKQPHSHTHRVVLSDR